MLHKIATAPLSIEEEHALIREWKEHRNTKARDRVIAANLGFAIKAIARGRRVAEHDDAEQEVIVGMMDALERFDLSRGVRFITYAASYIALAVGRAELDAHNIKLTPEAAIAVRGQSKRLGEKSSDAARIAARVVSLDEPVVDQGYNGTTRLRHEEVAADTVEPDDTIAKVLDSLMPFERFCVQRYYLDERTIKEIGTEIGVSREWVRSTCIAAIARVKAGRRAKLPLASDGYWADEAAWFKRRIGGSCTMLVLRAYAARRWARGAEGRLTNLIAYLLLAGRASVSGEVLRFDPVKRKVRA